MSALKIIKTEERGLPVIVTGKCSCGGNLLLNSGMTEGHVTTYKYLCTTCGNEHYTKEVYPRVEYEIMDSPTSGRRLNAFGELISIQVYASEENTISDNDTFPS